MNKRARHVLISFLLILSLLTSCRERTQPPKDDGSGIRLYFLNVQSDTGSAIASEPYVQEYVPTVRTLVRALLGGPTQEGLRNPFPSGTTLRSWGVEDGLATLDLSEQYGDLSGIDLTLADYCITLTLCQLEEVERVQIMVAGARLAYRDHDVLTPSEVMLDGLIPVEGQAPEGQMPSVDDSPGQTAGVSGTSEGSAGDEIPPEKSPAAS